MCVIGDVAGGGEAAASSSLISISVSRSSPLVGTGRGPVRSGYDDRIYNCKNRTEGVKFQLELLLILSQRADVPFSWSLLQVMIVSIVSGGQLKAARSKSE